MKKIFYIYDSVEEHSIGFFVGKNFGIVMRNNYKIFSQINKHYTTDWKVYEVGEEDCGDGSLLTFYKDFIEHDFSEFTTPEEEVRPMSPEELDALKKQKDGLTKD